MPRHTDIHHPTSATASVSYAYPLQIRRKCISNQLRGLLDVEPLHFVCSAASDATRVENMDAVSQLQFNASNQQQFSSTQLLEDMMFDSNMQLYDFTDLDQMNSPFASYIPLPVGSVGGGGGSGSGSGNNGVTIGAASSAGNGSNKISLGMGPGGKLHYIKVSTDSSIGQFAGRHNQHVRLVSISWSDQKRRHGQVQNEQQQWQQQQQQRRH